MDAAEFNRLLERAKALPETPAPEATAAPAPQPQMATPTAPAGSLGAPAAGEGPITSNADPRLQQPQGGVGPSLGDPTSLDAILGGGFKSIFETKDFLAGDTAPEDRSGFRASVEDTVDVRKEQSVVDGFSAGIGQFAVAMIGLGKFASVAKGVPWVGKGLSGLSGAINPVALETGKAALAGAIAFDPHEERLSNLIQGSPLRNPITAWLSADPGDSAAEGRLKAAFESIGMDAAVYTTFKLGTSIYKALRRGDTQAASRYAGQLEDAAKGTTPDAPNPVVDHAVSGAPDGPVAGGPAAVATPEAPVGSPGGDAVEGAVDRTSFKDFTRELPEADAGYAYHATNVDNALSIAEDGSLRTNEPSFGTDQETWPDGSEDLRSYWADSPGGAEPFTPEGGQPVLLRVKKDGRFKAERGTPDLFSTEEVPAAQIEYLSKDGEWRPLKGSPSGGTAGGVVAQGTPTEIAASTGESLQAPRKPLVSPFADEDTAALLNGLERDVDAMGMHGGFYQALEAGHTFGRGEGIPYTKLNGDVQLDNFMARVVDVAEERLDTMKGGKVLPDAKVNKLASQWLTVFNDDPATFLAQIQKGGVEAKKQVALMEAGFQVSRKMLTDAYMLSLRINMGDYAKYGSREAAVESLRQQFGLAASVYGSTRSMVSNAGRTVRRMRTEFKVDPKVVATVNSLGDSEFLALLQSTDGDLRQLGKLTSPTLMGRAVDFMQFLYVNNLVSGPKTQLINLMTNSYMVGARPMERIIGSALPAVGGNSTARGIFKESLKQYTYMGTALTDGFQFAKKAFLINDSIIAPHRTEYFNANNAAAKAGAGAPQTAFKPMTSLPNILHNATAAAVGAIGMPTRVLGTVDEIVKQTTYRSKVMSKAHVGAATLAAQSGLSGKAAKDFVGQYVNDAVLKAFDEAGRATDPAALREALVTTFQQELLPNTLGRTINNAVANHPTMRLVLPFVKTPTNVIRYGWKLSPVLNLAQTEYREMLKGAMGPEAQSQAMGQMALGTLFMGSAAYLVSNGTITGGGPTDPKKAAELKATGWQPYSVVAENEDGTKTYIPFGRTDPVAVPFGIIADVQDAIHNLGLEEYDPGIESVIGGLAIALGKQFTSKTYLTGVSDAMEALSQPDRYLASYGNRVVSNFIPFSAALRQLNPDPHMREARDLADRLMATVPGLSDKVPARYDAWGEPMLTRKGLWSSDTDSIVDIETQRLILESGGTITRPLPYHAGVDLRDHTTSDGRNAYEVYQQLARQPTEGTLPLKDQVAKVMSTGAYKRAPDGDAGTRGTKLWMLHPVVSAYRSAAMKKLLTDPAISDLLRRRQLRVMDQYSGAAPVGPRRSGLAAVGGAFGIDLDALLPDQPVDD